MKKFFLLASLLAASFNANAENIISVTPFATEPGVETDEETIYFEIAMNNDKEFTAFTFDMYLPDGLSFAADRKGNILCDLSEDRFEGIFKKGVFIPDAILEITDKGEGHYFVSLYDADLQKIIGTNGTIMKAYFNTDDTMVPGYYPITIKNLKIAVDSNPANGTVVDGDVTSYVKIGNPTNGNLTLSGVVPSFVNVALGREAGIETLDLSAVTAINGNFTYVDGRAVTAPTADIEVSASYAKGVDEGKYASLTLPFDATFEAETAYKLTNVADGYAMFDAVTSAQAGDVVLLTKDVNLSGTKLGTVANATVPSAYYVSADGTELRQGTNVNVPALRGVWNINAGSNLRIMLDGVATDINMIDVEGEGVQAFDLQGRRTANAKNGVYVVNGKKQIVK